MPRSVQQQAVINWATQDKGNAFVTAVAGAGKTSTLIDLMEAVIASPHTRRTSIAYAAFNKAIAEEVKGKLAARGIEGVKVGTFHSFGWNAWRRSHPKCQLAKGNDKTWKIEAELIRRAAVRTVNDTAGTEHPVDLQAATVQAENLMKKISPVVFKLVSYAKADALRPEHHGDLSRWNAYVEHYNLAEDLEDPSLMTRAINAARAAIGISINMADELIDFDDMLYMPVITGCPVWTNDWLLVDEAQDTNNVRMQLARMMITPRWGRAIFVGDPKQAIYGFAGADAGATGRIVQDFNCRQLPLTVTYRCPKSVVKEAQRYVSYITSADEAPEGQVFRITEDALMQRVKQFKDLTPDDAILCRKTAPLLQMAFAMIRAGQPCHVEGRDIGASLKKLLKKWKIVEVDAFLEKLEAWTEAQANKARAKGNEVEAEQLYDRLEAMKVLAEGCQTLECIGQRIDQMFQDGGPTTTLATVHRSKGREWQNVFILGANLWMPMQCARLDWEREQENNLIYVAITRSQGTLTWVDVEAAK